MNRRTGSGGMEAMEGDNKSRFFKFSEEEVKRVTDLEASLPGYVGFYEAFATRGINVDRVEPGFVLCTFKVPPRLADNNGNMSMGAVANLVDECGSAAIHVEGVNMGVSVDMSISYFSPAKIHDELEIISKYVGKKGAYFVTSVLIKKKSSGEFIAEGRHSIFKKSAENMDFLCLPKSRM